MSTAHIKTPPPDSSHITSSRVRCRQCQENFDNRHSLYRYYMREHVHRGAGHLLPSPYISGQEPWIGNPALREIYEINEPLILQRHQEGPVRSNYNLPLTNDFSVYELMEHMEEVYEIQQHAFRLNLHFGLILVNTETGEYRYFVPHENEALFPRPINISRRHDLTKLRNRLDRFYVVDYILQQRPNSKWKPVLVTNVKFSLYHLNYISKISVRYNNALTSNSSIKSAFKSRKNTPLYRLVL